MGPVQQLIQRAGDNDDDDDEAHTAQRILYPYAYVIWQV